jgi:UDP-glucose 4-epimerase
MIGSHLVIELLNQSNLVTVLDTKDSVTPWMKQRLLPEKTQLLRIICGDVRNPKLVEKVTRDIDTIFHLAAVVGVERASADPLSVMDTELRGVANILAASKVNGVGRIVYASSSEVYGASDEFPLREDKPVSPLSSYGVSKFVGEHYCRAYDEDGNVRTSCLRVFNAYGPGQDDRFVVNRLLTNALRDEPMKIHHDGLQTRDFTYIDDVVEGFILASEGEHGQVFNVGTGIETSILRLAETIAKVVNPRIRIQFVNPVNRKPEFEIKRRVADITKAAELMGFRSRTPLDDGIRKTADYVRSLTAVPLSESR